MRYRYVLYVIHVFSLELQLFMHIRQRTLYGATYADKINKILCGNHVLGARMEKNQFPGILFLLFS